MPCAHKTCAKRVPRPEPPPPPLPHCTQNPSVLSVCACLVFAASARRGFRPASSTTRYALCILSPLCALVDSRVWLSIVAGFAPQRVLMCATSDNRRSTHPLPDLSVHQMFILKEQPSLCARAAAFVPRSFHKQPTPCTHNPRYPCSNHFLSRVDAGHL